MRLWDIRDPAAALGVNVASVRRQLTTPRSAALAAERLRAPQRARTTSLLPLLVSVASLPAAFRFVMLSHAPPAAPRRSTARNSNRPYGLPPFGRLHGRAPVRVGEGNAGQCARPIRAVEVGQLRRRGHFGILTDHFFFPFVPFAFADCFSAWSRGTSSPFAST